MKKNILITAAVIAACLFTGCQSGNRDTNPETEALKEQIAQLEQQIDALQQAQTSDSSSGESGTTAPEKQPAASEETSPAQSELPSDTGAAGQDTSSGQSISTTYTIEELTDLVNAYTEKINSLPSNGTDTNSMDQFINLKQEEKQIDNQLDQHEDELERLYRDGTLTREEYKNLERELERLEHQLDDAEDQLEFIFRIDD